MKRPNLTFTQAKSLHSFSYCGLLVFDSKFVSGLEKLLSLGNDFDSSFGTAPAEAKFWQPQNDSKMGDFALKPLCLFSYCSFWKKICIISYEIIRYILLKVGIFGGGAKEGRIFLYISTN
ncbi:hypothetical protein [Runella zeae]|uniref:hypothetical protein n=1 Tax=Runella zeae TaxID=94255 RepID=UPI00049134B5|nr:hypothetical protein [Runella zeae]